MGEDRSISGKTFLITGAASGLGAGFAAAFLKEGAKKIAILDVAEKLGLETAERLNQTYPGRVTFVKCDMSKEGEIGKAFDKVVKDFGKVDVIINNAGIMNDSEDIWRTACDVNLWEQEFHLLPLEAFDTFTYITSPGYNPYEGIIKKGSCGNKPCETILQQGVVSLTMKGLKHMKKDTAKGLTGGTIINISSLLAIMKSKYLPIYSGCKSAVLSFSTLLAMDEFYDTTGVRILTMCFGGTDTALLQNLDQRSYSKEFSEMFAKETEESGEVFQRPEAAIRGVVDMFKLGDCGSVWVVNNNRPAINVTSIIKDAYDGMVKAIIGLTY